MPAAIAVISSVISMYSRFDDSSPDSQTTSRRFLWEVLARLLSARRMQFVFRWQFLDLEQPRQFFIGVRRCLSFRTGVARFDFRFHRRLALR